MYRGHSPVKKTLVYAIVGFWVVMSALFVRREVIPDLFARPGQGYESIRTYAQGHSGYRMGIFAPGGSRIGTAETTYQLKADGTCEVSSRANMNIQKMTLAGALPPELGNVELWSEVVVGPDNALKTFRITTLFGGGAASPTECCGSPRTSAPRAGKKPFPSPKRT
jgi:hypothetical protein